MENYLIISNLFFIAVSFLTALFIGHKKDFWLRVVSIGSYFFQFATAFYIFVMFIFYQQSPELFFVEQKWLTFGSNTVFSIELKPELWSSIIWMVFTLVLFFHQYFSIVGKLKEVKGYAVARALIALGGLFCILVNNLLTYILGVSCVVFGVFLGIAMNRQKTVKAGEEASSSAYRYLVANFFFIILFFIGALGMSSDFGGLSFEQINLLAENGSWPQSWAICFLLVGVLGLGGQFPFISISRYIAASNEAIPSLMILSQVFLAPVLFFKAPHLFFALANPWWFTLIAVTTCVFASFLMVSENDRPRFMSYYSVYVVGGIFLSGINQGLQAALFSSAVAGIALFIWGLSYYLATNFKKYPGLFLYLPQLCLLAVPGFTIAQSRFFEYLTLSQITADSGANMGFMGAKIFADLLVSLALWKKIKQTKEISSAGQEEVNYWLLLPLGPLMLSLFSQVFGGRIFSGVVAEERIEELQKLSWFENLIPSPQGMLNIKTMTGTEGEFLARMAFFLVFFLPLFIGVLWLFREEKQIASFDEKWAKISRKLDLTHWFETFFWDYVLRPIGQGTSKVLAFLDEYLDRKIIEGAGGKIILFFSKVIKLFDEFLSRRIVLGAAGLVELLGDFTKVLYLGSVQTYILFGLVVVLIFVIRQFLALS